MSDEIAHGIIEAGRLEDWAKTFHSKGSGQDSPLLREVKAHFSGDGITVTATDPSTVAAFFGTTLRPIAFESFESPGQAVIGLSLTKLIDILGMADTDQLVDLTVDMETRKLQVSYGTTEWDVATINPESIRSEPDQPDLDLDTRLSIEASDLKNAVEVADYLSDHMDIIANPDDRSVTFYAEGDTDDVSDTYGDGDLVDASVPNRTEARYSTGFMDALTKPIPDDETVEVRYKEEHPIMLEWSNFDGGLEVTQWLGPRIKSN